jgi:hypothetical protein
MTVLNQQTIGDSMASDLRDELKKTEVEPLLPIEKKLIGFSLGLGIFLLVVLAAINHFLPVS